MVAWVWPRVKCQVLDVLLVMVSCKKKNKKNKDLTTNFYEEGVKNLTIDSGSEGCYHGSAGLKNCPK